MPTYGIREPSTPVKTEEMCTSESRLLHQLGIGEPQKSIKTEEISSHETMKSAIIDVEFSKKFKTAKDMEINKIFEENVICCPSTSKEVIVSTATPPVLSFTQRGTERKRKMKTLSASDKKFLAKQKKILKHPLRSPCTVKICKRNCLSKIVENRRNAIHDQFVNKSWSEQHTFMSENTKCLDTKKLITSEARKALTTKYFLPNEENIKQQVCKFFFLTTLGFHGKNDSVLYKIQKNRNKESVEPFEDRRGKQPSVNKINTKLVADHIESFQPTMPHYYWPEHTPIVQYLPSDVTVKLMHNDFMLKNPLIKCSYEAYRKVVKNKNIRFTKMCPDETKHGSREEPESESMEEVWHENTMMDDSKLNPGVLPTKFLEPLINFDVAPSTSSEKTSPNSHQLKPIDFYSCEEIQSIQTDGLTERMIVASDDSCNESISSTSHQVSYYFEDIQSKQSNGESKQNIVGDGDMLYSCNSKIPSISKQPIDPDNNDRNTDYMDSTGSVKLEVEDKFVEQWPLDLSFDLPVNSVNKIRGSRKRQRHPEQWKRNAKKEKRNSGQSYETVGGNVIASRSMKPPCGKKCRLKCSQINEQIRIKIHEEFWKMGDLTRQRDFINKCLSLVKPKYSTHKDSSKRSLNNAYHFHVNGEKTRICKKYFQSTLDISNCFLSTAIKKMNAEGVVENERRGKHKKRGRALDDSIKNYIRKHINSYPKAEAHYCQTKTSKMYLEGDLNLCLMYRHYEESCAAKSTPAAKQSMYEHIFRNEFNIAFFQPTKDQCALCSADETLTGTKKENLESKSHIIEKELCRIEKEMDLAFAKENAGSVILCCFDLQAMQTPLGNDSLFYYKRKLNVYNCTMYDIINKKGFCYLWDETLGYEGSDEVGTCIYSFLKDHGIGKEVIFYTDNCVTQNKNKYLTSLYHYCVQIMGVKSITHKYLIAGHTQNECDSVHATIEREKKRILKCGSISVPSQWCDIIQSSKKHGSPYNVKELDYKDIFDLKDLTTQMGKNFITDVNGERVVWNNIKKIRITPNDPYVTEFSYTYENHLYFKLNIRETMIGRAGGYDLVQKFAERPKIAEAKKEDMLSLCHANLIPCFHWSYYENLLTKKRSDNEDTVNYSDDSC